MTLLLRERPPTGEPEAFQDDSGEPSPETYQKRRTGSFTRWAAFRPFSRFPRIEAIYTAAARRWSL